MVSPEDWTRTKHIKRAKLAMEMISRSPMTYREVGAGLGVAPREALRTLQALQAAGYNVTKIRKGRNVYWAGVKI